MSEEEQQQGERLQKVLAQAGIGSRREMEEWITAGRVTVNGEVATLGMRVVEGDVIRADKRTVHVKEPGVSLPRVLLYHKQEGEIVSRDDPGQRTSVFDNLPKVRGQKWIAIGRLDFNTSGLLIFTTSGDLANRLMHPRFEVEREYAVRVQGEMTPEQMKQMIGKGIVLDDGPVKFEKLSDEGGEGFNHWYRIVLKEGRNRVVRRTFEALGLPVSRLMRVRFGIVNLPPRLKRGMQAELGEGEVMQIMEWVGLSLPIEPPKYAGTVKPAGTEKSTGTTKPARAAKHTGAAKRAGHQLGREAGAGREAAPARNAGAKAPQGRGRNKTKTGAKF